MQDTVVLGLCADYRADLTRRREVDIRVRGGKRRVSGSHDGTYVGLGCRGHLQGWASGRAVLRRRRRRSAWKYQNGLATGQRRAFYLLIIVWPLVGSQTPLSRESLILPDPARDVGIER
jgi:hypothetical protein